MEEKKKKKKKCVYGRGERMYIHRPRVEKESINNHPIHAVQAESRRGGKRTRSAAVRACRVRCCARRRSRTMEIYGVAQYFRPWGLGGRSPKEMARVWCMCYIPLPNDKAGWEVECCM